MVKRVNKSFEDILSDGNRVKIVNALTKAVNGAMEDIYIHNLPDDGFKNLNTVMCLIEEYHQRYPYLRMVLTSILYHFIFHVTNINKELAKNNQELKIDHTIIQIGHHGSYSIIEDFLKEYIESGDMADLEEALDYLDEVKKRTLHGLEPTTLDDAIERIEIRLQEHSRRESKGRYFLNFKDL